MRGTLQHGRAAPFHLRFRRIALHRRGWSLLPVLPSRAVRRAAGLPGGTHQRLEQRCTAELRSDEVQQVAARGGLLHEESCSALYGSNAIESVMTLPSRQGHARLGLVRAAAARLSSGSRGSSLWEESCP